MVKAHVEATAHIVRTFIGGQFDVKKEYFLKRLGSPHVAGVNGDLAATFLTEAPSRQLVRGCGHLAAEDSRQRLCYILRKPNTDAVSLPAYEINIRLGDHHPDL